MARKKQGNYGMECTGPQGRGLLIWTASNGILTCSDPPAAVGRNVSGSTPPDNKKCLPSASLQSLWDRRGLGWGWIEVYSGLNVKTSRD